MTYRLLFWINVPQNIDLRAGDIYIQIVEFILDSLTRYLWYILSQLNIIAEDFCRNNISVVV